MLGHLDIRVQRCKVGYATALTRGIAAIERRYRGGPVPHTLIGPLRAARDDDGWITIASDVEFIA